MAAARLESGTIVRRSRQGFEPHRDLTCRWGDLDLDGDPPILTVSGTTKTETEKATYRKPKPKSDATRRTLVLPRIAADLLRVRRGVRDTQRARPRLRHPQRHLAPDR